MEHIRQMNDLHELPTKTIEENKIAWFMNTSYYNTALEFSSRGALYSVQLFVGVIIAILTLGLSTRNSSVYYTL